MSKKQFKKLMCAICQDSKKGLAEFYNLYGTMIQTTARLICRSWDKTNEAVNDVLLKIWKLAPTVEEIENPKGWIYTITINAAKSIVKERFSLPLEDNIPTPNDGVQEIFDRASFEWYIEDLTEIEQAIMIGKFVARQTFQEIADALDKPLTTVSSLYYRGLEKIKKKKMK